MNAETYKTLLKDLQKLEKRIAEAHIAAVRADPVMQAASAKRHAAAEVGGRADDYTAMAARKSAVQFLLRTVYVRVLEDLGALEFERIRGLRGEEAFRQLAPALGKRAYFAFIFSDLATDFPTLFEAGDEELALPSEDLCREAWTLWHKEDGRGNLLYDWRPVEAGGTAADTNGGGFESRFLGDLYQDLDGEVRKRFALLQTPHFVESYILDKTLTPALVEFDPEALRAKDETFRVLDPTCGSGHFLIGAWRRLAAWLEARGLGRWEAGERARASVWGSDINAHAVDIARFRLLLEVMAWTGERDLGRLRTLTFNLAVLDSLIPWERGAHAGKQGTLFAGNDLLSSYATPEERERNARFLDRAFHVVVGNPPYITPKDVKKRDDYRVFWPRSAAGKYALSAPFVERLFVLGTRGGFMGQITANSFMKREFGKKLVETVFPRWDLTGVVDTSGAYIPGHGTPTVILFGRARAPASDLVWAALGKRGEPKRPKEGEEERGMVWSAITALGDGPEDANPYVTKKILTRRTYEAHPWSLGGGFAAEIKKEMEDAASETVAQVAASTGVMALTLEDDVFTHSPGSLARMGVPADQVCGFGVGDDIRDYAQRLTECIFPYDRSSFVALRLGRADASFRFLWPYRWRLQGRIFFGKTQIQRGLQWSELSFLALEKLSTRLSITFAFVSTHSQFVLDRGGKVFNRTAPVIKLPAVANDNDHLDLLGVLNSSALGFWMKQVFHCKGAQGVGEGIKAEPWEQFYEYDSTKLQSAPLTTRDGPARIALARALDATATARAACLPAAVLASTDWTPADLPTKLTAARGRYRALTERMVALQEELDWLTYGSYALIDPLPAVGPDAIEPLAPGHRPFEILAARADDEADADEKSKWWSRHGHDRVTDIPARYQGGHRERLETRMAAIEADPRLQLLESFAYKRRWQTPDLDKEATSGAERWLLDRLEDLFAPRSEQSKHTASAALATPKPYRLEAVVSAWQRDPRVAAVAAVFTGEGARTDLAVVAEKLLKGAALPDNPRRVYTAEGLRKLDEWKRVWALQDQEDAAVTQLVDPRTGEPLHDESGVVTNNIPLPPKFDKADFQSSYFATRGKLNVPRERFILYADLSPARYGWNGGRDKDRALAQVEAFTLAERHPDAPLPAPTSDDPRRCGATLGLWESLPDVKRWANAAEHAELHALAQEVCNQPSCPCPVVERWAAWRRGEVVIGAEQERLTTAPTLAERGGAMALFDKAMPPQSSLFGPRADTQHDELPFDALERSWRGAPDRLERVLDDLVATGDLVVAGRGARRKFRRGVGGLVAPGPG
ncbi:DNA methylase [Deltaproteobacteria bacterium]|nr:DNA methylase [Deltaproteobacteria bacterium]